MSTPISQYEFETEWEDELEFEGEDESEEFFGRLAALARRAARSPALRRIGMNAARSALGSYLPQSEFEGEFETEFESEADQVLCLVTPEPFWAVGQWYADFSPTTDEQVQELLRQAKHQDDSQAA